MPSSEKRASKTMTKKKAKPVPAPELGQSQPKTHVGPRLFYVRDSRGTPVGAVAYRTTSAERGELAVGVSTWNKNDPFDKDICRSVALGRCNVLGVRTESPMSFWLSVSGDRPPSSYEVLSAILAREKHLFLPERFTRAAHRYLKLLTEIEEAKKFLDEKGIAR